MAEKPLSTHKRSRIWRFSVVLVSLIIIMGLIDYSGLTGHDWINRTLASHRNASNDIVMVTIDDESLTALHQEWGRWPWNRSIHAFLIEEIANAGARAIGVDILFSQPDINGNDGDLFLSEIVKSHPQVVLAAAVLNRQSNSAGLPATQLANLAGLKATSSADQNARISLDLPWALEPQAWRLGAVNFFADSEGSGRYYPLAVNTQGWLMNSLAAAMFEAGNSSGALPAESELLLNFQSRQIIPYQSYNYRQLYEWFNLGNYEAFQQAFSGKWVIIGATASGLFDSRPTPVAAFQPGIVLHGTALDNLLNDSAYSALDWWLLLPAGIFWLWVVIRSLEGMDFVRQLVSTGIVWLGSSLLVTGLALALGWYQSLLITWLPLVAAAGLALLINLLFEGWSLHIANIRTLDTFSRFLEPKIVTLLSRQQSLTPEALTARSDISVLFTDIRGFTTLSETKSAEEIITLLNQYFSGQVEQIFQHQGTFDKYIGDAIMAFWGAPVADKNHADKAVACALDMIDALTEFKSSLGPDIADFDIGIGIHSGSAVVGMLGSQRRYDYTAIGDTVNVASRIEGQTKGRARLLVSSETLQRLKTPYKVTSHGHIALKGRQAEVELFELSRIEGV